MWKAYSVTLIATVETTEASIDKAYLVTLLASALLVLLEGWLALAMFS